MGPIGDYSEVCPKALGLTRIDTRKAMWHIWTWLHGISAVCKTSQSHDWILGVAPQYPDFFQAGWSFINVTSELNKVTLINEDLLMIIKSWQVFGHDPTQGTEPYLVCAAKYFWSCLALGLIINGFLYILSESRIFFAEFTLSLYSLDTHNKSCLI